jgi:TPR repeat protein
MEYFEGIIQPSTVASRGCWLYSGLRSWEKFRTAARFSDGFERHDNGQSAPQDYQTALKWYTLAAEQGYAMAQFNLGVMYRTGQGVPQDYKTAVKWFTLAAEQGHAFAQGNLGFMYAFGKGVLKDYVYAHMWGNIAAMNGSELGGELRDDFEKQMIPSQLEKAQDLARECVAKNYKGCCEVKCLSAAYRVLQRLALNDLSYAQQSDKTLPSYLRHKVRLDAIYCPP